MAAIPTVHLNGTSFDALYEQNRNVADAIRTTLHVLNDAAPNGRDYCGPAFDDARFEHAQRIEKLTRILDEINSICDGIVDQEPVTK